MRKTLMSIVAATLVASPIALTAAEAAPIQHQTTTVVRERPDGTVVRRSVTRNNFRGWRKGQRFDRRYARNYQVIDYRRYRGLRAPPRGYRYVRSGNDAVLVGITSGIIASVIAGAIR